MSSECHAIEVARLPFAATCRVMAEHGDAILQSASAATALIFGEVAPAGRRSGPGRLVAGPLQVERDRWATISMHWLNQKGANPTVTSAWLRGDLHLAARTGSQAEICELLLTVRCDTGPAGMLRDDPLIRMMVERFIATIARAIESGHAPLSREGQARLATWR